MMPSGLRHPTDRPCVSQEQDVRGDGRTTKLEWGMAEYTMTPHQSSRREQDQHRT